MNIVAIVPAYNEAWNIRRLLYNLLYFQRYGEHNLSKVIAVCSGCTDGTDFIVNEIAKNNSKVYSIIENSRLGKTHALNNAIRTVDLEFNEAEAIVFLSSDVIPQRESIRKLVLALQMSKIGCAIANPVPLNDEAKYDGKLVKLLWDLHNQMNRMGWHKVTGEMFAIKKSLLKPLPGNIINDDLYIEYLVEKSKLGYAFVPDAKVYMWGPTSITELFEQRRRVNRGHFQLSKQYKARHTSFANTLKVASMLFLEHNIVDALTFGFIESASKLAGYIDSTRGSYNPIWKMIKTSKGNSE